MKKRHLIFLAIIVMLFTTNVYARPVLDATKEDCIKQGFEWDEETGLCYLTGNKQPTTTTPSEGTQQTDNSGSTSSVSKIKCGNVTGIPKKVPEITSYIISVLHVAIPVILVLVGSIDLVKGIVSGKDDEIKKGQRILVKRLITSAIVFFTVVIVRFIVSVVDDSITASVNSCVNCFISNKCTADDGSSSSTNSGTRSSSGTEIDPNATKKNTSTAPSLPTGKSSSSDGDSSSSDDDSSNTHSNTKNNSGTTTNNNTGTTTNNTSVSSNNTIFIGDSRTVGMCAHLSGASTDACDFEKNKGSGYKHDNIIYVSKSSTRYTWFSDTAVPGINKLKGTTPYNIVILMGVNDVGATSQTGQTAAGKYYSKVLELANSNWKNDNIVFVSVNPVLDGKSYAYMAGVNGFNTEIKSKISASGLSNLSYCDTASKLTLTSSNYDSEGLHYDKATYEKIKSIIMSDCLK